jgi:hypothetical protein
MTSFLYKKQGKESEAGSGRKDKKDPWPVKPAREKRTN